MKSALISIIIPTFNRAHLIKETLNSFVGQDYSSWEIVVVDDESSDNTKNVVEGLNDSRISYSKRPSDFNKGPSSCRNYGLSKAKGEYVLFFDDDDLAHPDLLQICMAEFSSKEIDFCRYEREIFHGKFEKTFDREKKHHTSKIDTNDLGKMIINKLPFNTCAVIWKFRVLGKERFNEDLFYSDEWEFYQRLLSKESIIGININKVLLFARKHENSSTGNFLNDNPKYLNSTRKAMKLVIQNLYLKGRITPGIKNFFIRRALELKDKSTLIEILEKSNSGFLSRARYILGFRFYPVIRPIFKLKGKLKF